MNVDDNKNSENFEDIIDGEQLEDGEDFEIAVKGDNKEDNEFDNTVGVLQDILLDEKFE